jgi:hypothetical protein
VSLSADRPRQMGSVARAEAQRSALATAGFRFGSGRYRLTKRWNEQPVSPRQDISDAAPQEQSAGCSRWTSPAVEPVNPPEAPYESQAVVCGDS